MPTFTGTPSGKNHLIELFEEFRSQVSGKEVSASEGFRWLFLNQPIADPETSTSNIDTSRRSGMSHFSIGSGEMLTKSMFDFTVRGKSALNEYVPISDAFKKLGESAYKLKPEVWLDDFDMMFPPDEVKRSGKTWDTTKEQLTQFRLNNEQERCGRYVRELANKKQSEKLEAKRLEAERRKFGKYDVANDW